MKRARRGVVGIPFSRTQWALALAAFGVAAQAAPLGPEFRVNSHTTERQVDPAVAMDADGDFVVAWTSYHQDAPYTRGIFAQRYDKTGAPQGDEFQVNTFTLSEQTRPAVAMDADGDFVVVWAGVGPSATPVFVSYDIQARRYDAAGVAQDAEEFVVNTNSVLLTEGGQSHPSIAMDPDGDFVVSWIRVGFDGEDSSFGFFARRFAATGAAQGGEITVRDSLSVEDAPSPPTIAMDQANNFVVVWGESGELQAQRYDAAGLLQGSQFQVNAFTTGTQRKPVVAMDQDGDFVVAWEIYDSSYIGYNDVYFQRFNAAGAGQGEEFLVHSSTAFLQAEPAVAMEQDGDFVIAWTARPGDGYEEGVIARRFSAAGVADGPEFQVNTHTTGFEQTPTVAVDQEGDFVIAWEGGGIGQDGSLGGIYAQRFGPDAEPLLLNARFAAPQLSGKSTSNTPVPEGLAGTYQFTSKFCLSAGADITDLFSRTKQLTNNNSLISRTRDAPAAPPGGVGSEQDFPLNLGYADGVLSASECVDVIYKIGLASKASFTFRIDLYGNVVPAP